jgi:ribosomal protein L14E/L6E/L27E
MGLFGRKKKEQENSSSEWTSFEFVQFIIKYPDTSDDNFVEMYSKLLGEDTLEKDLEDYWKKRLDESFISQEEFQKIKKTFNQRFKKIRTLAQAKKDRDDIAKWAVTNTDDDRITNEDDVNKDTDENSKDSD